MDPRSSANAVAEQNIEVLEHDGAHMGPVQLAQHRGRRLDRSAVADPAQIGVEVEQIGLEFIRRRSAGQCPNAHTAPHKIRLDVFDPCRRRTPAGITWLRDVPETGGTGIVEWCRPLGRHAPGEEEDVVVNESRRAPGSFLAAMPESTSDDLLRAGTRKDFDAGRCVLGRDVAGYDGSWLTWWSS